MIDKLRAWAIPFTADEDALHRSRLLAYFLGAAFILGILNFVLILALTQAGGLHEPPIGISLASLLLVIVCFFILRQGRVSLAGVVFTLGLQALVAWALVLTGAALVQSLIFFIPIIICAGLILGPRGGLALTLTSIFELAAIAWARFNGWIPSSTLNLLVENIPSLVNLAIISMLTLVLAIRLERALREMRQRNQELARLNNELAQLKEFNEHIVQTLEEGVVITDAQGVLIFTNPRLEAMLGYDHGELIGRHRNAIIPARAHPTVDAEVAKRPQGVSSRYETLLLTKDGRELPVLVAAAPLFEKGQYVGTLAAIMDISARVHLEETQREFIAIASHDLRSPLQSVAGYLDLILSDEEMDPATQREFVQTARNEAERLISLADTLLDWTRLEAGQMDLNPQPADVQALAGQVLREIWPLAQKKNIQLVSDIAPQLPPILVDAPSFHRVLMNLAANALKFTPEGGTVRITAAANDGEVLIQVCDSGPGIPEEELPKVFERFYRGKSAGRALGVGLGLTIARQLVEAQRGKIWAQSTPGQGSVFSFTVPMAEAKAKG